MGFDPLSLTAILAGTAVSARSSIMAGRAANQAGQYNARMAEMQARDAELRGQEAEARHRKDVSRLTGSQRAALAGQGVDVNDLGGSAMDIQTDTAYLGELDALTIRNNAAREAWGFRSQAANYSAQGRNAQAAGTLNAAGTLLGGGMSLYRDFKMGST